MIASHVKDKNYIFTGLEIFGTGKILVFHRYLCNEVFSCLVYCIQLWSSVLYSGLFTFKGLVCMLTLWMDWQILPYVPPRLISDHSISSAITITLWEIIFVTYVKFALELSHFLIHRIVFLLLKSLTHHSENFPWLCFTV